MDKSTVLRIISDYGKALEAEGVKPQKIILFGSYSTGTQHEGSDIDLVVISEDFASKDYWERIDVLAAAIVRVFEPIEAIAMTPEEWEKKLSLLIENFRLREQMGREGRRRVLENYTYQVCAPRLFSVLTRTVER